MIGNMKNTTRQFQNLTSSVDTRLAAYAALAGAALAAPALPTADADIIYSGIINLNIPTTEEGIYLNLVTGVSATNFAGASGWDINPWGAGSPQFSVWTDTNLNAGVIQNITGGASATSPDNIPLGTLIDGSWSFVALGLFETSGPTALSLNSTENYIGFRFFNESTSAINFGWAKFSLSGSLLAQPRTLVSYAYENTGAGINAGAIPEPSSLSVLGLMAAGSFAVRRWRKDRTTQSS